MSSARLQVAFDAVPRRALRRAVEEAITGGADVIEIGTPLLKRYGTAILEEARKYLPTHVPLYADVKMLDFADLELTPALEAGANEVTAVAFASNESLTDALRLATTAGADLSVSTMNFPLSMLAIRLDEIQALGIDRFVAHGAGRDLQAASEAALERAREIRGIAGTHLLIGGGIRPTSVHELVPMLPATIIAGRSVTASRSVRHAVTAMRRALDAAAAVPHPEVPRKHVRPEPSNE